MKKTLIPLFFAAVSMAANMQAKDNDPVVITVNGQKVLRSEFEYFYNKNNDQDVLEVCLVLFTKCNLNCPFCF